MEKDENEKKRSSLKALVVFLADVMEKLGSIPGSIVAESHWIFCWMRDSNFLA
jgi:hypothetical protein